ncbi:MAG: hypothetical protein HQM08_26895 [Candidatus Riflebacteria bacterium]|nr:hypothetical protein [Candidatus Riflebacteria bacterium]
MKRWIKIMGIAIMGGGILFVGFAYDLLFAGIPYQDPTPEIQSRWEFHSAVAGHICLVGFLILLLGIIAIPVIWLRTRQRQSPYE